MYMDIPACSQVLEFGGELVWLAEREWEEYSRLPAVVCVATHGRIQEVNELKQKYFIPEELENAMG